MPIACPVDLDVSLLRSEISTIYGRVASEPGGDFHFHRGPAYAAEFLGYDATELASLPPDSTASFAGVSNPLAIGEIPAGATVLDIGCVAGMDLLLAGKRVGPAGRAIGVDMTDAMIDRARKSVGAMGLRHVEVRKGDATALPVQDASIDVVISNCVLNLVPEKERAFAEVGTSLAQFDSRRASSIPAVWASPVRLIKSGSRVCPILPLTRADTQR